MYVEIADIYDRMYHFKDYAKESTYIIELVQARHPSARTMLEVASGTGRFMEYLKGPFEVEGLDLSAEMLLKASERLPGLAMHQGNMSEFSLDKRYGVVACLFRSIAYSRTAEGFHAAIQAMARHVAPGGLLLVEPFFTPESFWIDRVTLNEYQGEDMKLAWMYLGERKGMEAHLDIHCLVGTSKGVEHFTELHCLGLFTREQYQQAFSDAGLELEYEAAGPSGIGMYIGKKRAAT